MGNAKIVRRAFNAGEISKRAKYRNDVEKHMFACHRLENFYVSELGSVSRREGTRLLEALGPSSAFFDVRLVPFEYNSIVSYFFCFYVDTENNKTAYTGRSFAVFPESFKISMAFEGDEMPSRPLFKAGNTSATLFYDATSGGYTLQISDGENQCAQNIGGAGSYTVDIEFAKNSVSFSGIYNNGEFGASFQADETAFAFLQDGIFTEYSGSPESELSIEICDSEGSPLPRNCVQFNSSEFCMIKVLDAEGKPLLERAAATPIPASALQKFQFKQVGGYFFVSHPSILPQRLSIDLVEPALTWEPAVSLHPSLDQPETAKDGKNITATFKYAGGAGQNLEAGENIVLRGTEAWVDFSTDFDALDDSLVGSQLKFEYLDEAEHTFQWKFDSTGKCTPWYAPSGKITVTLEGGNWDGILLLEESTDDGRTWSEIARSTSIQASSNEGMVRESFSVNAICRCRMLKQRECVSTNQNLIEAHKEGCFFNIVMGGTACAWAEILEVERTRDLEGAVVSLRARVKFLTHVRENFEATKVFRSVWNRTFGYPRCVEIHEERLCLAGTTNNPHTVWLSQTNNWDNFRSIANMETDPLSYTLAANEGEPICWLFSVDDLMIGTASQEWSLGSRDSSQSLSLSIVKANNQSEDGAEYIMPARAGGMLIYVKRGFIGLEAIQYDFASDSYGSISLVTMHPHILKSGVRCVFNQLTPQNRIYCVRKDGQIAVFTYDKANNVSAWGRLSFGNGALSACPLSENGLKSVFLAVSRGNYTCLERLDPEERGTGNWLDCVPISDKVHLPLGLKHSVRYKSFLETTPIFLDENCVINSVKLAFLESYGGKARISGLDTRGNELRSTWHDCMQRSAYLEASPVLADYKAEIKANSGYAEEAAVEISTDEEAPMTLLGIAVRVLS
nr:MAG TPA: stabilization protein [Caudoviricetes sp.]